jgi:hypothetical protein
LRSGYLRALPIAAGALDARCGDILSKYLRSIRT